MNYINTATTIGIITVLALTITQVPVTVTFERPPVQAQRALADSNTEESLQNLAKRIAKSEGVDYGTIEAIVFSESRWDPKAVGDHGHAHGLAQINDLYHPDITLEEAESPEFALRFIAQIVKDHEEWKYFTSCSCVACARVMGANVKGNAIDLVPDSLPVQGGVIIFKYGEKPEDYHVAYIAQLFTNGMNIRECNKEKCRYTERFVSFYDPFILGYKQ